MTHTEILESEKFGSRWQGCEEYNYENVYVEIATGEEVKQENSFDYVYDQLSKEKTLFAEFLKAFDINKNEVEEWFFSGNWVLREKEI